MKNLLVRTASGIVFVVVMAAGTLLRGLLGRDSQ